MALGRLLAPHLERGATRALTHLSGQSSHEASSQLKIGKIRGLGIMHCLWCTDYKKCSMFLHYKLKRNLLTKLRRQKYIYLQVASRCCTVFLPLASLPK
jgi:hypothetical protein